MYNSISRSQIFVLDQDLARQSISPPIANLGTVRFNLTDPPAALATEP
jgi:hypothetical protein